MLFLFKRLLLLLLLLLLLPLLLLLQLRQDLPVKTPGSSDCTYASQRSEESCRLSSGDAL